MWSVLKALSNHRRTRGSRPRSDQLTLRRKLRSCRTTSAPPIESGTKPPVLLLKGDDFYVSNQGIARTFYRIDQGHLNLVPCSSLAIEELYDIRRATKEFVLRQDDHSTPYQQRAFYEGEKQFQSRRVLLGDRIGAVKLQEIDQSGLFGDVGTGATTWEASIAMVLYFSRYPEQLRGHVIEVGCGMGLGGILIHKLQQALEGPATSTTLTDGNEQVVRQCQENILRNIGNLFHPQKKGMVRERTPIQVTKLDWIDFSTGQASPIMLYDTVIACDCAYQKGHDSVLCETVLRLLRKDRPSTSHPAMIHLFGPYNRSALYEVIRFLNNDELGLNVDVGEIQLNRFRLGPDLGNLCFRKSKLSHAVGIDGCSVASQSNPKFLHVRVSRKRRGDASDVASPEYNLSDID
jgi:hypothetical protein